MPCFEDAPWVGSKLFMVILIRTRIFWMLLCLFYDSPLVTLLL